jgi:hypothetical protein
MRTGIASREQNQFQWRQGESRWEEFQLLTIIILIETVTAARRVKNANLGRLTLVDCSECVGKALVRLGERFEEEEIEKIWGKERILETMKINQEEDSSVRVFVQIGKDERRLPKKKISEPPEGHSEEEQDVLQDQRRRDDCSECVGAS